MKRDKILNPHLIEAIAQLGHTQTLVIGDAGLPIPPGVRCIDLSVVCGVPSFRDVLAAIAEELVVESAIYASEAHEKNPEIVRVMQQCLPQTEMKDVSHEIFKAMTQQASVIVRTGECTSYANIILTGGVNF